MNYSSSFSFRLREIRKAHELTQKQAADKFGLSEIIWRKYENGTRTPTFEGLLAIADYFNIPLDYLCGRDVKNG